jgi:hypothetical protein
VKVCYVGVSRKYKLRCTELTNHVIKLLVQNEKSFNLISLAHSDPFHNKNSCF